MTSGPRLDDTPQLVVPKPPAAAGPPSSPAGGVSCASCGDTFPSMVKYETHRGTCQKPADSALGSDIPMGSLRLNLPETSTGGYISNNLIINPLTITSF